jgi:hypothetical protein
MSEFTFRGKVSFRSSKPGAGGPPGEAEVLRLNPQRKDSILHVTGWSELEPGSLNLEVADEVVSNLGGIEPELLEAGDTVKYPAQYANIPRMRGAYMYFRGVVAASGRTEEVLIRRAKNPVPGRVELFAQCRLRSKFGLSEGDTVTVTIHAS